MGCNLGDSDRSRAIIASISHSLHAIGVVFVGLTAEDEVPGDILYADKQVAQQMLDSICDTHMDKETFGYGLRSSPCSLCENMPSVRPVLTTFGLISQNFISSIDFIYMTITCWRECFHY